MKPPAWVGVDGHRVRVRVQRRPLGQHHGGYSIPADYGDGVIRLDAHATREGLALSLLGELLHHLWERARLPRFYSGKDEERIIHDLDVWLLRTLRDNPELLAFLTS